MLSGYAQELQALKTELQHTLARLGGDSCGTGAGSTPHAAVTTDPLLPTTTTFVTPSVRVSAATAARREQCSRRVTPPSWSVASTQSISTARTTPDAPLSSSPATFTARPHTQSTALDARQLIHELRVASQRRRALEMELAREMQCEQEQRRQRQRDACAPYQQAISALQRQRAEIARQIEADRARDRVVRRNATTAQHVVATSTNHDERSESNRQEQQEQEPETPQPRHKRVLYRDSSTQMSPMVQSPPPSSRHRSRQHVAIRSDSRFAIEGLVTLEPVQDTAKQRQQHRPIAATATPAAAPGAAHAQSLALPELVRCPRETHYDALNDVFSIQLQFAETMRKLEQSVQVREELLQRSRNTSGKTRLATAAGANQHRRRRHRQQQPPLDSDNESVSDSGNSDDNDDDGSVSSDASLNDYRRRLEQRYTANDDHVRPGGTAAAAPASHHPQTQQPQSRHSHVSAVAEGRDGAVAADNSPSQSHDPHTPSTESSDKTTGSSVEKTVRFHGALATPVIAKKLFANPCDESDESDLESALSFLNGSSVASAELNDVSLVKAFEAFRRELGMFKGASLSSSPPKAFASAAPMPPSSSISAAISAARALFTAADDDDDNETECDDSAHKPLKHQPPALVAKPMDTIASTQPPVMVARTEQQQQEPSESTVDAMDRQALEERRRQLCLDIQAESAQLVLTFGSRNAHETARIKQTLIELRSQLRQVDERLAAVDR